MTTPALPYNCERTADKISIFRQHPDGTRENEIISAEDTSPKMYLLVCEVVGKLNIGEIDEDDAFRHLAETPERNLAEEVIKYCEEVYRKPLVAQPFLSSTQLCLKDAYELHSAGQYEYAARRAFKGAQYCAGFAIEETGFAEEIAKLWNSKRAKVEVTA